MIVIGGWLGSIGYEGCGKLHKARATRTRGLNPGCPNATSPMNPKG